MAQSIKTTSLNGFHISFSNGWTASIQWNPGSYCDNYNKFGQRGQALESSTVEVACWPKDGKLTDIWDHGDSVKGYMPVEEIPAFLTKVASFPKN